MVKRTQVISAEAARSTLRTLIKSSGLTQSQFAKKTGDSPESLSMTLSGHRGLSRRMTRRLGLRRVIAYAKHPR